MSVLSKILNLIPFIFNVSVLYLEAFPIQKKKEIPAKIPKFEIIFKFFYFYKIIFFLTF